MSQLRQGSRSPLEGGDGPVYGSVVQVVRVRTVGEASDMMDAYGMVNF